MCLSNVYLLKKNQEKELICKNIASMTIQEDQLVFTNLMGIPTVVEGTLEKVDLMDNFIVVRSKEA